MKAVKDLPVRAVIAFDPDREEKELVPENVVLVRWVPQQDVLGKDNKLQCIVLALIRGKLIIQNIIWT
ncbi:hypothetical protein QYM36_001512 [Artemia franciscana]|uniref:Uncharacterized protein n=2 Tax=Artemia franciscana TaxID=6661 RepID=A0AA88LBC8_ARTSF|nr:hypothetical protein QYM36_001512 [Artemia franciscana]